MSREHRNYNPELVVAQLNKKHDIFVPSEVKEVRVLKGDSAQHDIGIKSKGKIDFLRNYCGYLIVFVNSFKY